MGRSMVVTWYVHFLAGSNTTDQVVHTLSSHRLGKTHAHIPVLHFFLSFLCPFKVHQTSPANSTKTVV